MLNGTVAFGKQFGSSYHMTNISIAKYIPRRNENMDLHQNLYTNFYSSVVHRQNLETTKFLSIRN